MLYESRKKTPSDPEEQVGARHTTLHLAYPRDPRDNYHMARLTYKYRLYPAAEQREKMESKKIRLSGIGNVKIRYHRETGRHT